MSEESRRIFEINAGLGSGDNITQQTAKGMKQDIGFDEALELAEQVEILETQLTALQADFAQAEESRLTNARLYERALRDNETLQAEKEALEGELGRLRDEHHTMQELYMHRHALFSVLCGLYYRDSWKSKLHEDGTMYEGWFIAGIPLQTGMISYHMPIDLWDKVKTARILETAPHWDGYTPEDVINRLFNLCKFIP